MKEFSDANTAHDFEHCLNLFVAISNSSRKALLPETDSPERSVQAANASPDAFSSYAGSVNHFGEYRIIALEPEHRPPRRRLARLS